MTGRIKLTYDNGNTEVHFVGAEFQDAAICGQDLAGDYGYEEGVDVKDKVDCQFCIRVVEYCKGIKTNEFID